MFFPEGVKVVSTHAHWKYRSSSSLERFKHLGKTAEVFESSQKVFFLPLDFDIENMYIFVCQ